MLTALQQLHSLFVQPKSHLFELKLQFVNDLNYQINSSHFLYEEYSIGSFVNFAVAVSEFVYETSISIYIT